MRTAIITENIVTNIAAGVVPGIAILADEWCAIGARFDPDRTPRFLPQPVQRVWTSYEFLRRFTWQERSAIRIAGFDDDAVADFLTLCTAAQEVVSDDPVTQAGMDYLVSLNLLTPARRAEILS